MEKIVKESGGGAKKGAGPPMAGMMGGGKSTSTLPPIYENLQTTPFTNIKVPADGPVKLELTSQSSGPPGKK
jgi:hypothetical protein